MYCCLLIYTGLCGYTHFLVTVSPVAISIMDSLIRQSRLTDEQCNKKVTDVHLDKISHVSHCQWRRLPPYLEMKTSVVTDIDQGPGGEDEKRQNFFFKWRDTKGSGATYKTLICALLEIECREDAENVCRLCTQSSEPSPSDEVYNAGGLSLH